MAATCLFLAGCGASGGGGILDCDADADCIDGDVCTTDMCVEGTCRYIPLGTCGPQPAVVFDLDDLRIDQFGLMPAISWR